MPCIFSRCIYMFALLFFVDSMRIKSKVKHKRVAKQGADATLKLDLLNAKIMNGTLLKVPVEEKRRHTWVDRAGWQNILTRSAPGKRPVKLGSGTFGTAFSLEVNEECGESTTVVVKQQTDEEMRGEGVANPLVSLEAEAKTQHGLKHQNILQLYDWIPKDEKAYSRGDMGNGGPTVGLYSMLMEFAPGGMLEVWINGKYSNTARMRRLEKEGIAQITARDDEASRVHRDRFVAHFGMQMVRALAYMHEKGVVHRDLKPQNIFIVGEDCARNFMSCTLKVADFGLACTPKATRADIKEKGYMSETLAACYSTAGTPFFIPPESYGPNQVSTSEFDLWSVGVILFMMQYTQGPRTDQRAMPFPPCGGMECLAAATAEVLNMDLYTTLKRNSPNAEGIIRIISTLLSPQGRRGSTAQLAHAFEKHWSIVFGHTWVEPQPVWMFGKWHAPVGKFMSAVQQQRDFPPTKPPACVLRCAALQCTRGACETPSSSHWTNAQCTCFTSEYSHWPHRDPADGATCVAERAIAYRQKEVSVAARTGQYVEVLTTKGDLWEPGMVSKFVDAQHAEISVWRENGGNMVQAKKHVAIYDNSNNLRVPGNSWVWSNGAKRYRSCTLVNNANGSFTATMSDYSTKVIPKDSPYGPGEVIWTANQQRKPEVPEAEKHWAYHVGRMREKGALIDSSQCNAEHVGWTCESDTTPFTSTCMKIDAVLKGDKTDFRDPNTPYRCLYTQAGAPCQGGVFKYVGCTAGSDRNGLGCGCGPHFRCTDGLVSIDNVYGAYDFGKCTPIKYERG